MIAWMDGLKVEKWAVEMVVNLAAIKVAKMVGSKVD